MCLSLYLSLCVSLLVSSWLILYVYVCVCDCRCLCLCFRWLEFMYEVGSDLGRGNFNVYTIFEAKAIYLKGQGEGSWMRGRT